VIERSQGPRCQSRKKARTLSCESSDVVANIDDQVSTIFLSTIPRPPCDMSDYGDDEQQGVVTRVKVTISFQSQMNAIDQSTEHSSPPPPHRRFQTRPTRIPNIGPLLQHLLLPPHRLHRCLSRLLLVLHPSHRLQPPYPSSIR
jgi:hypothetical protein